jgi:hypothetical protein
MGEELISFNTAKLAKEKGFDISGNDFYYDLGNNNELSVGYYSSYAYSQRKLNLTLLAPNQSLLQKWLREKHKLHVAVYPIKDKWDGDVRILTGKINNSPVDFFGYDSYEEALEVGLYEALKLI